MKKLFALFISAIMLLPNPKTGKAYAPPLKMDLDPIRVEEVKEKRTKNSETFRMSDGTYECVIYAENKYCEQNETLVEIDDTIIHESRTKNGTEYFYANKTDDVKTCFGKDDLSVLITTNAYSLSFKPAIGGCFRSKIGGLEKYDSISEICLSGKNSIAYSDSVSNSDYVYKVNNGFVKEFIVLNDKTSPTNFTFIFNSDGLTAKKTEYGTVWFLNQNEDIVFELSRLFAVDSAGAYTEDVEYSVSETINGKTTVSISLSQEYAASSHRVFPIIIDPSIVVTGTSNVYDAYVSSKRPSDNFGTNTYLRMGWDSNYYIRRTYIRYDISALPSGMNGYHFVEAYLSLKKKDFGTDPELKAYRVTGNWLPSTITWNNKPSYSTTNASAIATPKSNNWYRFYVTGIVYDWYAGYHANNGFLIKNEQESGTGNWSTFYSTNADSPNKPELRIRYREENFFANIYLGFSCAFTPLMESIATYVSDSFNSHYYYGDQFTHDFTKADFISELTNKKVISTLIHGQPTYIKLSNDETFSIADLSLLSVSDLAKLRFVCLGACLTGYGGENANNFINALYSKGVDAVIGFNSTVPVDQTNLWVKMFMSKIASGETILSAMQIADSTVIVAFDIGDGEDFGVSSLYRLLRGDSSFVPCPY